MVISDLVLGNNIRECKVKWRIQDKCVNVLDEDFNKKVLFVRNFLFYNKYNANIKNSTIKKKIV